MIQPSLCEKGSGSKELRQTRTQESRVLENCANKDNAKRSSCLVASSTWLVLCHYQTDYWVQFHFLTFE